MEKRFKIIHHTWSHHGHDCIPHPNKPGWVLFIPRNKPHTLVLSFNFEYKPIEDLNIQFV